MSRMKETGQHFILMVLIAAAMLAAIITASDTQAFADTELPEELSDNGIPILSINIDPYEYKNIIISNRHSYTSYSGSISITVPEGYTGDYGDAQLLPKEELELEYLRGRGKSTWLHAKKPFKFKLKESTDLLGMGANKPWVLLANAFDGTMLRNRITGYMARQLGRQDHSEEGAEEG